jgi:hypothetical protein
MKTKHLAVAVIVLALAVSANVFGDSLTLTGTGIQVTSVNGLSISGGSLSFSDTSYSGGWTWGNGGSGTLSLTGSVETASGTITGTLLSDDFTSATVVDLSGTSIQVTLGAIQGTLNGTLASDLGVNNVFSNGGLVLALFDPAQPQVGQAFTSTNEGGLVSAGGTLWSIGGGGSVSASDPGGTVSASEPWNLPMSLVFFGIVAGMFGVLVRARVLRFAHA